MCGGTNCNRDETKGFVTRDLFDVGNSWVTCAPARICLWKRCIAEEGKVRPNSVKVNSTTDSVGRAVSVVKSKVALRGRMKDSMPSFTPELHHARKYSWNISATCSWNIWLTLSSDANRN